LTFVLVVFPVEFCDWVVELVVVSLVELELLEEGLVPFVMFVLSGVTIGTSV
jgi:hypothetical protein